ncbi:MAG: hypothetical protein ACFFG0_28365 [Candidatus Thorarchaeota archaeon]
MSDSYYGFTLDQIVGIGIFILTMILVILTWKILRKDKSKKSIKSQTQISKNNTGDTIQTGDKSKVIIDKSKHTTKVYKTGTSKKENENQKREIQINLTPFIQAELNSNDNNEEDYEEDNDVQPNIIEDGDFNLEPNNFDVTYYDNLHGTSGKKYVIHLGELNIGDSGEISCKEVLGEKFSCFIIDESNFNHFGIFDTIKHSIRRRMNVTKCKIEFKIKFKGRYYVLFTHRGQINGRRIKYRLEIYKS